MNYLLHIIATIGFTLPTVLGFNLVFGRAKILHFGPIAVSIVAAYGIFLTREMTGSYCIGFGAGLACALTLSLFFAWLSFRLEADALGILTIAVHLSVYAVVLNATDITHGAMGVAQIPRALGLTTLPVFAAVSVCIGIVFAIVMHAIDRSSLGRALAALAEHPWHAQALGISKRKAHTLAFLIAGVGAAITNFFSPQYLGLLHLSDYTFQSLIFVAMCVVAGGPGSVWGVVTSVTLLTVLKEGIRFMPLPYELVGPLRLVLFGVILIIAIWVRRKTLFPIARSI